MRRKAYGICLFLLAAVLVVAIAACGKRGQREENTSTGVESSDQDKTAEDIEGEQTNTPEEDETKQTADGQSGQEEDVKDSAQTDSGEDTEAGKSDEAAEKDETGADSQPKEERLEEGGKEPAGSPERIGIYTIDDETLETVSLTAMIDTAGGLTPEAVVEAVALALEDHLIEISVGSITVDGKKVTVDIQSEDAKLPFGNAGSSVEGVILDCITYSLFDNFKDLKEIYFTVNGGAYESGHISLAVGEAYQTK